MGEQGWVRRGWGHGGQGKVKGGRGPAERRRGDERGKKEKKREKRERDRVVDTVVLWTGMIDRASTMASSTRRAAARACPTWIVKALGQRSSCTLICGYLAQ